MLNGKATRILLTVVWQERYNHIKWDLFQKPIAEAKYKLN